MEILKDLGNILPRCYLIKTEDMQCFLILVTESAVCAFIHLNEKCLNVLIFLR